MNMYPEIVSEQNRAKIKAEMDRIRLEEEAIKGKSILDKNLALLGNLMVAGGEKLRKRTFSAEEANPANPVNLVNKAA